MLYVRISLMHPKSGHEGDVASMMDKLVAYYSLQTGFIAGYKLAAADGSADIGRVTVWDNGEHADAVAQSDHVLAVRSELLPLIDEPSVRERSFYAEDASKPLAELLRQRSLLSP